MNTKLLTPQMVAERIGGSGNTARTWMMTGLIPNAQRFGNTWIIEKDTLEREIALGVPRKPPVPPGEQKRWYTTTEAKRQIERATGKYCSWQAVHKYCQTGRVLAAKVGKRWAIPKAQYDALATFKRPGPGRPKCR